MKKIICVLLSLTFAVALFGCSKEKGNETTTENDTTKTSSIIKPKEETTKEETTKEETTKEETTKEETTKDEKNYLTIGQAISIPDYCDVTIESVEFTKTLGPKTSVLKIEDESKIYLAVKIRYTNTYTKTIDSYSRNDEAGGEDPGIGEDITLLYNGKYTYEGSYKDPEFDDIAPLTVATIYAAFEVPVEIENNENTLEATLSFGNTPYTLKIR